MQLTILELPTADCRLPIADGHWRELPDHCSIVKLSTYWIPAPPPPRRTGFAGMTGVFLELPIVDCRLPIAGGHWKEVPHYFFNRQAVHGLDSRFRGNDGRFVRGDIPNGNPAYRRAE